MKIAIQEQVEKDIDTVTVVTWYKKIGDCVKKGEAILHAETLKGDADVDAPVDGVLAEIFFPDGEMIPRPSDHGVGSWNAVFGSLEAEGTSQSVIAKEIHKEQVVVAPREKAQPHSDMAVDSFVPPDDSLPIPRVVKAGPQARRMAREFGVDLTKIEGRGPRGIITVEQVLAASNKKISAASISGEKPDVRVSSEEVAGYRDSPLSMVRRVIAENMELSGKCIMRQAAGCSVRVDFRNILNIRTKLKRALAERFGEDDAEKYLRPEVFVVDGILRELREDSRTLNSCFGCTHIGFEGIRVFDAVNLGIACQHPAGLVVPVLKGFNGASYREIADRLDGLYKKVQSGGLKSSDMNEGTFTFNNAGALGADDGESIIIHGQSAICTFYKIERESGSPFYGFANLALRFDHRVFDGFEAVRFLSGVKKFVEDTDYGLYVQSSLVK